MAVIEELVARLGFKVEGLGELKKYEGALDKVKTRLRDFGTTLNKALVVKDTAGLSKMSLALTTLSNGFKAGISNAALFVGSLGRVALAGGAIVAGIGLVAFAVLKLGAAFVKARGEAAQLRREMQIDAIGNRTTAANVDGVVKGFDAVGPKGGEKAKGAIGELAEAVNEAIKDLRGEGNKKFKGLGINVLDPRGNQRDTTEILDDVIKNYLERQTKVKALRSVSDADKGSKRKLDAANKVEWDFRKDKKENYPGINKELQTLLETFNSYVEYKSKQSEAVNRNPPPTPEQEDRSKRISEGYRKLEESLAALATPFQDLGTVITVKLLGPLNALADGLVSIGQRLGLINQTKEQAEGDAARAKIAAAGGRTDTTAAVEKADQVPRPEAQSWFERIFREATAKQKTFNEYDQAKRDVQFSGEIGINLNAASLALKAAAEKVLALQAPQVGTKGLNDNAKTTEIKNADFGHDKRTQSVHISQTVNGVPGVAAAAAAGAKSGLASMGASIAKTNTTATTSSGGTPAP